MSHYKWYLRKFPWIYDQAMVWSRFEVPPQYTGFTWVDTVALLREVARKMADVAAVAVDVEHNHTRSYLGTVCLLQLSDGTTGANLCLVCDTSDQQPY